MGEDEDEGGCKGWRDGVYTAGRRRGGFVANRTFVITVLFEKHLYTVIYIAFLPAYLQLL